MRIPHLLVLTAAFACGCDQSMAPVQPVNPPASTPTHDVNHPTAAPGMSTDATTTDATTTDTNAVGTTTTDSPAENSEVNQRDRDPAAKTPIDQNETPADIKITADIRKMVLEQPDFSVNARNVKIITADGRVTLRGPVTTDAEKQTIEKIAADIAGADHVDSMLEVSP